ncbi:MAG: PIN domain-containing protein [Lachnospiraceae bacterium]|nr:PIN domain-containing protein [Lachnospiraceae bacterium]
MLLVIDTNIIVSAIKSGIKQDQDGNLIYTKAYRLMADVFNGKHRMVVSKEIFAEYEDVLHRPRLQLDALKVEKFLAFIKLTAVWIEPVPTTLSQLAMIDEDDRVFFDAAKCLNIKLITNNLKHYPVHELRTKLDELY